MPSCYTTGLSTAQISALKSGVNIGTINGLLTILYDFILFGLSEQPDQSPPNEK